MFHVGFGDFNIIIGIVIFIALVITLVWTLIKDGRQDSSGKKITAGEKITVGEKNTDRKDLSAMSPPCRENHFGEMGFARALVFCK